MSKENAKALKTPVEIIKTISRMGWGTITRHPLAGVKARMRRAEGQFLLNWTNPGQLEPRLQPDKEYQDLSFDFKGHSLILEAIYSDSEVIARQKGVRTTEHVDFFHTSGFNKKTPYRFRLILPLDRKMSFIFQLSRKTFTDDFDRGYANGTRVIINGDELKVGVFHDDSKKDYLTIESQENQSFDIFSNKAHAAINGLGFLTGYLAGNAGWYFAYDNNDLASPAHFYHTPIRKSIYTPYTPVNTNPHTWIRDRNEADRLFDLKFLQPVSIKVFSNLCQKLYDSVDFSSAVLLILEAGAASLIFRPGGYAIVLETLADLIIGEEKAKAPMNKALSKTVREKLTDVINSECKDIPEENRNILLGKINQINQVTNKSRLRIPFDELGLLLNEKDLELIATRNDFLHGRIPDLTNSGIERPDWRKNKDLFYASVRFYTLLSRLILAWVGYDNYILNHAKIQEKYTRILLEEDYYIQALTIEAS